LTGNIKKGGSMKHTWYTYKDFVTGKIRKTRGAFKEFTAPLDLIGSRYAIFELPASTLLVPEYLLTKETKEAIKEHLRDAVDQAWRERLTT